MDEICVTKHENLFEIKSLKKAKTIKIDELEYNKEYKCDEIDVNDIEKNKIFSFEKRSENDVLIVYSDENYLKYLYGNLKNAYKKLIKLKYKIIDIKLNKKKLKIRMFAYLINKYNLNIAESKFFINENIFKRCNLKQYNKSIKKTKILMKNHFYNFEFDIQDIIRDNSMINGSIRFYINTDGNDIDYKVGIKNNKIIKNKLKRKYYNLPIKHIYLGDYSIHIRRTIYSNLILVKRLKDPIENTLKFKIMENSCISFFLYEIGKIFTKIRRKNINLFYEKFAEKAEEGVYELYSLCKVKSRKTKNYFVIDKKSKDYEKIRDDKNVVAKFSLKYYWLIYNCRNFVASEAPSHLNILRSNNKYLRRATYDKDFIFLQHGIIYMKNLGINSSFSRDRDAECKYMIVSSEKEKNVVSEMLGYDKNCLLNTGLAMYDNLKYNHISSNSKDIVTIMLTWKPYEEQLYKNFAESSYYKNTVEIYNTLKDYIDENKIIIIGHPKVNKLLMNTDLKKHLWDKQISDALEITKLLITDYSSVCYDVFYQGAGVIFYQPDLQVYEEKNGKLIPDNNEYIGKRIFDLKELKIIFSKAIINNKINLQKLRTLEYENRYLTINEHNDGKNIEKIYTELFNKKII